MSGKSGDSDDNLVLHYIALWAERRGKTQADFVRELDIGRSTASRWFHGDLPDASNVRRIAQFLNLPDPKLLFRHPDEDWIEQFVKSRSQEELDRMVRALHVDRASDEERALKRSPRRRV